MKRVDDLFDLSYGVNLELNSLNVLSIKSKYSVNFVSRTSQNNGVSALVEKISGMEPIPAGTLSVACGGSVMETFLQPEPYYSGRDIYYLTPKIEMTDIQKLYYCRCLRLNKYKYNYGRQANKTLGSIFIPEIFEIPKNLLDLGMPTIENFGDSIKNRKLILDPSNWNYFTYDDIFIIERGESVYLQDMLPGKYPYISATSRNNGISSYVDVYNRNGNVIVVNYDGSIGEAFYQEGPFFASEKVATIKLKDYELNQYIAFFIITLIKKEKFRFNYGLKWSINKRMKKSIIKLPVTSSGQIDFPFMEEYIKSLSFSANI